MNFAPLHIAALLASALRSAIPDPAQQARDQAQDAKVQELGDRQAAFQAQVDASRSAFDTLVSRVQGIEAKDSDQQTVLDGLVTELTQMADVLTGPAGDTTDNGIAGEVQPAPVVISGDVPTSETADTVVETSVDAGADISDPLPVLEPEPAPIAEQGGIAGDAGKPQGGEEQALDQG